MIDLRDYQIPLGERLMTFVRNGKRRILVQMSTGAGKTYFAAHYAQRAVAKGMRVHFLVHRRELIKQTLLAMDRAGLKCGIIAAGFPADYSAPVQICSIPSLARRLSKVQMPNLVIADEIHHAPAASWSALLHQYTAAKAVTIGLSATPWRLTNEGLSEWFDEMLCGPSTAELIQQGWLSKYRLFAPGNLHMDGVKITAGDYNKTEMDERMKSSSVLGDALTHYQKFVPGKRALIFAWSIESSIEIAQRFNQAGVSAVHIDGDTDDRIRDRAISMFANGDVKVLSNVNIAVEGLDISGIETLFMLRPTESLTWYLQAIGRALRPHPGKTECQIFDHVQNCRRHGLPDDERIWTLDGRPKNRQRKAEREDFARVCPKCALVHGRAVRVCDCGEPLVNSREMTVDAEAELSEVDAQQVRRDRLREQGKAKDLEGLIAFARSKQYKNPHAWAAIVLRAREEKKARIAAEKAQTRVPEPTITEEVQEQWLF